MSCPAFMNLDEFQQLAELRQYLKSKGSEIAEDNVDDDLIKNLAQVLHATDVLWKEGVSEADAEMVVNSIISLLLVIPLDKCEGLIVTFCEKVSRCEKADKKNSARLRLLTNLFHGLDERSHFRFTIYCSLVKLAGRGDLMHLINPNIDEIKKWVAMWDISCAQFQSLLRILHDSHHECKESEKATKVMIELLSTYTEDNASQARDDAHKCIVTCLGDPNTYIFDHLLSLKPVKFLEGELIHDLLTIFVSGHLSHYLQFYETNKDFIASIGLSHDANLQKMRLLTMMSMVEAQPEVTFETIERELRLAPEDVESFVIEVIATKAVRAKIDQMGQKIIVSSTTHRTFGKPQWQQLYGMLDSWQNNLSMTQENLTQLVHHAMEQAK